MLEFGLAIRLEPLSRSSFHPKPHLRSLLLDRRGCETPRRKDLRTKDFVEDVLGVVMVVVDVVMVVVVRGEVIVVEIVDKSYLIEVEVVKD